MLKAIDDQFNGSVESTYIQLKTLYDSREKLRTSRLELEAGKKQAIDGQAALQEAQAKLNAGKREYEKGLKDYEEGLMKFNEEIEKGQNDLNKAREDLEALLDRGTTILLISENNFLSDEAHAILEEMVFSRKRIMPLYSGYADYESMLCAIYKDLPDAVLKKRLSGEEREKIFTLIRQHITLQRNDFLSSESYRSAKIIHYPEVAQIPDYAFTDCAVLEEVYIPDTVVYISSKAFYKKEDVLVRCAPGSHAESYCVKHHIRYETQQAE